MTSHILICTDGSEYSEGAVREGLMLAKRQQAKVTALMVIDFNAEFDALAPNLLEKMEEEAAGHVRRVKTEAEKEGISCQAMVVRSETPYLSIAEEAAARHVNLIVMGRRGKTGLKRLLIGSVAKRTIGHAPCNVLVIPRKAHLTCRTMVVATDGSKFSEIAAAEAVTMAKACGARLVVVTAVHAESTAPLDIVSSNMQKDMIAGKEMSAAENSVRFVKELAEKENVAVSTLIYAGSPADVIIHASEEKKADLIVVGSHGRTGIDRLLLGSVAERVIGTADCATLVVKAR
ncbi:MAG: universal stress protein [Nitrospirae bacterium]|nr:universal stress protein [Nitrospirota bacterium]